MQTKALSTIKSLLGEYFDVGVIITQHQSEEWDGEIVGNPYAGKEVVRCFHEDLTCPMEIDYDDQPEPDEDDEGDNWKEAAEGS